MNILKPGSFTLERTPQGFLRLVRDGQEAVEPVECYPLFPVSRPQEHVSLVTRIESEEKEVGVIASLAELDAAQRKLVQSDIHFRYFMPKIVDVARIEAQHGIDEWTVTTDRGPKVFYVQDKKEHVVARENGMVLITDIHKGRYQIPDYRALPAKARAIVESSLL